MTTLDLPLPLTPPLTPDASGTPARRSLGVSTQGASCDSLAEQLEDGDKLMRSYVRANLAHICIELQAWDHSQPPKPTSLIAHAAELLACSWKDTFNPAAAAHIVETFVRDECVAQRAATTVPPVPATWRTRLLALNFWLQVVGASMGLLGQMFINERNAMGFVCWIISNCALVALQRRTKLRVLVFLHTVYLLMSFQGLYLWLAH